MKASNNSDIKSAFNILKSTKQPNTITKKLETAEKKKNISDIKSVTIEHLKTFTKL